MYLCETLAPPQGMIKGLVCLFVVSRLSCVSFKTGNCCPVPTHPLISSNLKLVGQKTNILTKMSLFVSLWFQEGTVSASNPVSGCSPIQISLCNVNKQNSASFDLDQDRFKSDGELVDIILRFVIKSIIHV